MSYKNYNIFALKGDTEVSDADVCEQLGLDPSLAGTPAINEAAIQQMQKQNYQGYIAKGIPEEQAMAAAVESATNTRRQVKELMAQQPKK
jgi:hypothetical protein